MVDQAFSIAISFPWLGGATIALSQHDGLLSSIS
jgi:hypothetical protein